MFGTTWFKFDGNFAFVLFVLDLIGSFVKGLYNLLHDFILHEV